MKKPRDRDKSGQGDRLHDSPSIVEINLQRLETNDYDRGEQPLLYHCYHSISAMRSL